MKPETTHEKMQCLRRMIWDEHGGKLYKLGVEFGRPKGHRHYGWVVWVILKGETFPAKKWEVFDMDLNTALDKACAVAGAKP